MYPVFVFLPLLFFSYNSNTSLEEKEKSAGRIVRAELKLYSFCISEIAHSKETKDIKIFFKGKEIKLGQVVLTKDKDIEIEIRWTFRGNKQKVTIETDLYEDGWITELSCAISEIPY